MMYKIKPTFGLIALTILIPVRMLLQFSHYSIMNFFLWLSTISIVVFLITSGIYKFLGDSPDTKSNFLKFFDKAFLASKIAIGFSLIISFVLFFFNYFITLFSSFYNLDYKLFLPFSVLIVIGYNFLKDDEVFHWLKTTTEKLLPVFKDWFSKSDETLDTLKDYTLKNKFLVGGFLLLLLLAFILPEIFKSPVSNPSLVKIITPTENMNKINRDFDQRLFVEVLNEDVNSRYVYLEIEQLSGDSLIMGFIGQGSKFEKAHLLEVYPGYRQVFNLLIHAFRAQTDEYELKVNLYEADSLTSTEADLVETKNFNIKIHKGELDVDYKLVKEEPFSLRKTFLIKNNGGLISDFSLICDSLLKNKINITPSINNYRFQAGEEIAVNFEPDLYIGFAGLEGKVIGTGGGAGAPLNIPVSFKPPGNKKLFLAFAHCETHSDTRVCECINQGRTRVDIDDPPAYTGYDPYSHDNGTSSISPPPESEDEVIVDSTDVETEADSTENETLIDNDPFGELELDVGSVTKEQIIRNANNLKARFEQLKEEFEAPNYQGRINRSIEVIDDIISEVQSIGELTTSKIRDINSKFEGPNKVYDELIGFELINGRRDTFVGSLGEGLFEGRINLRINSRVASSDNSGAPTIFIGKKLVHFAWHKNSFYENTGQRVYYSNHQRNGTVKTQVVEMNPGNENGRWPYVAEGDNGIIFFTWQGSKTKSADEVLIKSSNDGGKTWSKVAQLTDHGKGVFSPRIISDSDAVYVYWIDFSNITPSLVASHSNDGTTFSKPTILAENIKRDGVAKIAAHKNTFHVLYEKVLDGVNEIIYQKLSEEEMKNGRASSLSSNEVLLDEGSQPSIAISENNELHIAYVKGYGNQSEIHFLHLGEFWQPNFTGKQITFDSSYSYSPSVSVNGNTVNILYHSNSTHHGKSIDNFYLMSKSKDSFEWSEAKRLPNLSANGKKIYLSVNFILPWSRRIYNEHDVKIFLNGWLVGELKDMIPEGNILLPVNPKVLHHKPSGATKNVVTLETKHFNPAHYLAASKISLISDLQFMEQFVYADNQKEADELLSTQKKYNHSMPDIGIYATTKTKIPSSPQDGEEINLKLKIWNIGQGNSSVARVDIYRGGRYLKADNYSDRNLLAQKRITHIEPHKSYDLDLPFTYWSGLEKIFIRVTSKEKDFNLQNNTYSITFKNNEDSPLSDSLWRRTDGKGVLRVAVYNEPGLIAKDVEVKIFKSGSNYFQDTSTTNPKIWIINPDIYDIFIKSKSVANVEQWIRGVPIGSYYSGDFYSGSYQSSISLDILLQKIDVTLDSLGAVTTDSSITFEMPSAILFYPNEYEVNLFAEDYMKRIKTVLNAYPESILKIEGNTDSQGDAEFNKALSEKRALAVKRWLIEKENIDPNRLTTHGWGETKPIADNTTSEGRSINRRVNFTLYPNN